VIATLSALPFLACTNADVEFTNVSGAGSAHAGAGGHDPGSAGSSDAGSGAIVDDAGTGNVSGDAGEAGATGNSGTGGTGNAGAGSGGVPDAGTGAGGSAGLGGVAGSSSGAGGVAGSGGVAGGGAGAGAAGDAGGGAGRGGGAGNGGGAGRAGGGTAGATGGGGAGGAGASGGAAGASPICGNNLLDGAEQCDDGNNQALDACDAACGFEQSQRANAFEQEFVTSSLCRRNAFGAAFLRSGRTVLQTSLSDRVESGSLSLLFAFRGLADLTGTSTESIALGVAYGAPAVAPNYNGKSDRDWWYTPAPGQIKSSADFYSSLAASLAAGLLSVNSGSIQLPLLSDAAINVSSTKLRLNIGRSSKPLASSSGAPPGHLASEHLSPSLVSFASGGQAADGDPGELCGNLSAASLATVAIPAAYTAGGSSPCTQDYAATRTFLDLLVGGCSIGPGGRVILATQPDQADPGAPPAGAGAPYRLISNANSHAVSGCRDKNNAPVSLATCLKAAAFSSAYSFKTGRVIIK
jgi:cysteine-rich repeat protein